MIKFTFEILENCFRKIITLTDLNVGTGFSKVMEVACHM